MALTAEGITRFFRDCWLASTQATSDEQGPAHALHMVQDLYRYLATYLTNDAVLLRRSDMRHLPAELLEAVHQALFALWSEGMPPVFPDVEAAYQHYRSPEGRRGTA